MKKLVFAVVVLSSLLGCGPEQSASDKAQQQISAQLQSYRVLYAQYNGTYTGTITYQNGTVVQVSLSLVGTATLVNNVGTGSAQPTPTVSGSLNTCLIDDCFSKNPNDTIFANTADQVSYGNYDQITGILELNTAVAGSGTSCGGLGSKSCAADTIDIQWTSANHTGLFGVIKKAGIPPATLNLVRRI